MVVLSVPDPTPVLAVKYPPPPITVVALLQVTPEVQVNVPEGKITVAPLGADVHAA